MDSAMKGLRSLSRRLHRGVGIGALAYFFVMAVSGVLLNHPDLISGLHLARSWVPGDYAYRNWNRNSLRGAVSGPEGESYLYGEAGVWRIDPEDSTPVPVDQGYETSAYYRDTRALLRVDADRSYLLAGTRGGLYALSLGGSAAWQRVSLGGGKDREAVVDLLTTGDRILAVTRSHLYASEVTWPPRFESATPARFVEPNLRLPLFRLVFHMHSGSAWGLPGRLLVDGVGLLVAFLCVTGGYFWWRKRRRTLARGTARRLARRGLSWHIRLGLWAAPLVLFVAVTGFFQRPPFLVAIAFADYEPRYHPAPTDPNPWHDLLRKAAYDPDRNALVLSTADGFYRGPVDLSAPFRRMEGGPPVSVMGATVLFREPEGWYWVGSMSGLYVWDPTTGWVTDVFTGGPPVPSQRGPVGEYKVVGFLRGPGGETLTADYDRGLLDAHGRPFRLPMPEAMDRAGRISLWHALFELHNGRIFGFLLGWWAWVVVPLGGTALLLEVATGLLDRCLPRRSPKVKPPVA